MQSGIVTRYLRKLFILIRLMYYLNDGSDNELCSVHKVFKCTVKCLTGIHEFPIER